MLVTIGISFSDLKEESQRQLLEMVGKTASELGWDNDRVNIAVITTLAKER